VVPGGNVQLVGGCTANVTSQTIGSELLTTQSSGAVNNKTLATRNRTPATWAQHPHTEDGMALSATRLSYQ
ncbi:hypothetical protein THOM_2417, partial [Trachipleistophora hominis]